MKIKHESRAPKLAKDLSEPVSDNCWIEVDAPMILNSVEANIHYIWRFPEMVVPLVIINFSGMFHEIDHPLLGTPMAMESPKWCFSLHRDRPPGTLRRPAQLDAGLHRCPERELGTSTGDAAPEGRSNQQWPSGCQQWLWENEMENGANPSYINNQHRKKWGISRLAVVIRPSTTRSLTRARCRCRLSMGSRCTDTDPLRSG